MKSSLLSPDGGTGGAGQARSSAHAHWARGGRPRSRQRQHCSPGGPEPMTIFVCRSAAGVGKVSAYVWPVEN